MKAPRGGRLNPRARLDLPVVPEKRYLKPAGTPFEDRHLRWIRRRPPKNALAHVGLKRRDRRRCSIGALERASRDAAVEVKDARSVRSGLRRHIRHVIAPADLLRILARREHHALRLEHRLDVADHTSPRIIRPAHACSTRRRRERAIPCLGEKGRATAKELFK